MPPHAGRAGGDDFGVSGSRSPALPLSGPTADGGGDRRAICLRHARHPTRGGPLRLSARTEDAADVGTRSTLRARVLGAVGPQAVRRRGRARATKVWPPRRPGQAAGATRRVRRGPRALAADEQPVLTPVAPLPDRRRVMPSVHGTVPTSTRARECAETRIVLASVPGPDSGRGCSHVAATRNRRAYRATLSLAVDSDTLRSEGDTRATARSSRPQKEMTSQPGRVA